MISGRLRPSIILLEPRGPGRRREKEICPNDIQEIVLSDSTRRSKQLFRRKELSTFASHPAQLSMGLRRMSRVLDGHEGLRKRSRKPSKGSVERAA